MARDPKCGVKQTYADQDQGCPAPNGWDDPAGEDEEPGRRFGWFPRQSTLAGVRETIERGLH